MTNLKSLFYYLVFIFIFAMTSMTFADTRQLLTADWRFHLGDAPDAAGVLDYAKIKSALLASAEPQSTSLPKVGEKVSFAQQQFNDSDWRPLDLPHDFSIESPFQIDLPASTGKLKWWGVAWYRKTFNVAPAPAGTCFYLDMDGAMSYSTIWCNGQFVGGWPYGYSSYRVDLTGFLRPGESNTIAVRLDNPPSSSRWYPGGGIYRNVWLVTTAPVHVDHWGTTITTPTVTDQQAAVHVRTQITNRSDQPASVNVQVELFRADENGAATGSAVASAQTTGVALSKAGTQIVEQDLSVKSPKLWSPNFPNRYVARTTILQGGQPISASEIRFGIRSIRFDANTGFWLNGEHVKLNGVCNHSDLGALGMAVHVDAMARQIALLKEMGCNAIRMCHNPPAPELLDLCDQMGMLVIDEAFDCWMNQKNNHDYHTLYADWHEKDLRALVRRDRNHPSVILWSIGNEIGEQTWKNGAEIAAGLTKIVHEEDPTRPTTAACDQPPAGWNGFQNSVGVFGYNYKPGLYAKVHDGSPNLPIYGSETASCISSRGEYFFPLDNHNQDFQVTSYDTAHPGWASIPDLEFKSQDEHPFVCGEFVWTGFDYLGEPTPYNADMTILSNFSDPAKKADMERQIKELGKIKTPSRSSYFGIFDLCGFRKDRYYLYQARWRPEVPMAHLLPHWTWPGRDGQVTPVQVYTSGDEAELFVNGVSQGRKKRGRFDYRLVWDTVKYQPGEIHVVAYRNGAQWAEDTVKTAGQPTKIQLTIETPASADAKTLSYVTVRVLDAAGNLVPQAKNKISFAVTGAGQLIATDNGDATDLTSFQSADRCAFNGLALAIVQRNSNASGPIQLAAHSDGLEVATLQIQAK